MRRTPSESLLLSAAVFSLTLAVLPEAAAQEPATKPMRAIAAVAPAPTPRTQPLKAGTTAPDFAVPGVDGAELRLAEHAGKVVVLDFWATWCGPCLKSLPDLQAVAKARADEEFVVLAVCTSDTRANFDRWIAEHGADYPNVIFARDPHEPDADDFAERISKKLFHVSALPTTFVIGRDGKIAATIVGHGDDDHQLDAGLARAGLTVDPELAAKGEAQLAAAAKAAAAREASTRTAPMFFPQFGALKAKSELPDFALTTADGDEFRAASLRGKPYVLVLSMNGFAPRSDLETLASRYAGYGLQTVLAVVSTAREDFERSIDEQGAPDGVTVGWDPAGKFVAAEGDDSQAERTAFHATTLIGKLFKGGMYPALPIALMADAEGRFVAGFRFGETWQDAVGNLLLHVGVELRPEDLPAVRAPAEAFAPPAPRPAEPKVELIAVGAMAPDFTTQDLEGAPVRLADFRGKVVVLDFWATWCGPCKVAMPHVQQLAAEYADQGVVVIASCTSDGRAAFEKWVREKGGEYPDVRFAHDAAERSPERASRALYGVSGIPAQFVIDRDGKIVAMVSGYRSGEVLLDAALAKAGIDVDAAVLEQAAKDQAARDGAKQNVRPALPLKPIR